MGGRSAKSPPTSTGASGFSGWSLPDAELSWTRWGGGWIDWKPGMEFDIEVAAVCSERKDPVLSDMKVVVEFKISDQ